MKRISLILVAFSLFATTLKAQDLGFDESKTTVGGYGELHYNSVAKEGEKTKKTLDFHRFVIFYSHSFNEKWSFKSEVELEHNSVGENKGGLELEQAMIDYRHSEAFGFQAGVILVSAGIINDYHEPPIFFGVERPDYQKYIIPTTWAGNGAAIYGNIEGFDYKFSAMEGLNGDKLNFSSGIRSARQGGFKVNAESFLYTARVNYTKIDGLQFGVSATFNEAFRSDSSGVNILLLESHLQYARNNIYITAEAGNISYSNQDWESSLGYYADFGYNVASFLSIDGKLIPFLRYSDINTVNSFKGGGDIEKQFHNSKIMFGINYLPLDEIVFKLDLSKVTNELTSKESTLFNLGIGYMF